MAPPQFDAAFVDVSNTSTLSVTVGANNNRVLYFYTDLAATNVALGAQSFTDLTGDGYLWRLVAPATGTANVVASGTIGANPSVMALSVYDAHQTTPERTTPADGTPITAAWTFAVTSVADDLVIDLGTVAGNTFSTTGSGQTERIETQLLSPVANYRALSSTRVATGTSTNMSWTGSSITAGFLYLFAVRPVDAVSTGTPAFGRYRIAGARR